MGGSVSCQFCKRSRGTRSILDQSSSVSSGKFRKSTGVGWGNNMWQKTTDVVGCMCVSFICQLEGAS